MTTHTITLARHTAQVVGLMGVLVLGTWDSYGTEQLLLRHGPEWDGLAIDATFHNVPNDEGVTVLADTDGLVTVPPEACKQPSKYATITFRGVQDGVQRISCNLPYMVLDHAQVPGANSTATPSENAQALAQMQDLRDGAVDAKRHAEAARDAAANSATAAAASEKAAASSAVAAAGSAAQAEAQKTAAAKSASDAQGYMQTASGAATAANASAKNAEENAASAASAAKKAADESVAANIAVIEKMQADVASKQTAAAGDAKTASDAAAGAADAKAAAVAAQKDAAASKAAAAKSAADADDTANSIKDSMAQISENKEAVSKLKKDTAALQKRQNVLVGSETGNPVSCDDAFAAPLCGLYVYGKSTQDGTPTPDAPVPIVSAGDGGKVTVKVTGRNLLNIPDGSATARGVTVTAKDGLISISGTAISSGYAWSNIQPFITSGVVILSSSITSPKVKLVSETWGVVLTSGIADKMSNMATRIVFIVTEGQTYNLTGVKVQLELGTTATAYSPYREQLLTLPTPNGLPGIPVTFGGNYTDQNGQQWVCDEVDLERGVKVQRVYKVEVDGKTARFAQAATYVNLSLRGLPIALYAKGQRIYATSTFTSLPWFFNTVNGQFLYLIKEDSSDQLNESCKKQLGKVYYALATPIETPLTPAEIAAYKALTAYGPDTVVQASDGAGIKLDYQRDVNLVVKNLEDAIASMTTT